MTLRMLYRVEEPDGASLFSAFYDYDARALPPPQMEPGLLENMRITTDEEKWWERIYPWRFAFASPDQAAGFLKGDWREHLREVAVVPGGVAEGANQCAFRAADRIW